jgi:hypothetical protein
MNNMEPVASISAYRRAGGAVVNVDRRGRARHRYCVSLKRHRALREWILAGPHPWSWSGSMLSNRFDVALWPNLFSNSAAPIGPCAAKESAPVVPSSDGERGVTLASALLDASASDQYKSAQS